MAAWHCLTATRDDRHRAARLRLLPLRNAFSPSSLPAQHTTIHGHSSRTRLPSASSSYLFHTALRALLFARHFSHLAHTALKARERTTVCCGINYAPCRSSRYPPYALLTTNAAFLLPPSVFTFTSSYLHDAAFVPRAAITGFYHLLLPSVAWHATPCRRRLPLPAAHR